MVGGEGAALRAAGGSWGCTRHCPPAPRLQPALPRLGTAFIPLCPSRASLSALSTPPGPRVQPQVPSARAGRHLAPRRCCCCRRRHQRALRLPRRSPIKAAGQRRRVLVSVRLSVRVSVRVRSARPRDAGAQRRPPPASPSRGPAAAARARLHMGGRSPRLQRGRRRLAEPCGVFGGGRRQPAAGTGRAGGEDAGDAGPGGAAWPRVRRPESGKVRAGGRPGR